MLRHRGLPPESANAKVKRLHLLVFNAEEKLHRLGRDREIVALAARLPKGGQVTERVRACLHLGDVAGAAAVWRGSPIVRGAGPPTRKDLGFRRPW